MGRPIPDHLYGPEILPGFGEWVDAFWELSTDRDYGMGFGPIPSGAIERYAEKLGYDLDEADIFTTAIRAMDRAWIDQKQAEMDADKNGRGKPKANPVIASRPLSMDLFDALWDVK